jgi:lysophospholipase L1-like esterase
MTTKCDPFVFLHCLILLLMAETQQQPLRILALGDSLTEGYYDHGRAYHPYATHLSDLFSSAKIPVKIDQNDLCDDISAETIFKEGLEPMYERCLNYTQATIKLAVMTVAENSIDLPTGDDDKERQALNRMIRDYVAKSNNQDRVCLVDLDKGIPYHSVSSDKERQEIWDDTDHFTAAGYDLMATIVFNTIKDRL